MAWAHSVAVTIDHTKVQGATQTNFPMLFAGCYPDLATVANGGAVTNANGYDILFAADAAGLSPLNFERAVWMATTGGAIFYVQIPSLSNTVDTTIYILYGNAAVTTDLSNRSATWDSDFNAVWHMCYPRATMPDSTSNGNIATSAPNEVTGSEYGCPTVSIAGTGAPTAGASSSWNLTSDVTISYWVKTTDNNKGIFQIQNGNPLIYVEIGSTTAGGSANKAVVYFRTNGGGVAVLSGSVSVNDGNWHHVQIVRNTGSNVFIYVDGVLDTTSGYSDGGAINCSGAGATVGGIGGFIPTANINEIRLSKIARSANWIKTDYNNMGSISTFYSTSLTSTSPTHAFDPLGPVITGASFVGPNVKSAFNYQVVKGPFLIAVPASAGGGSFTYAG